MKGNFKAHLALFSVNAFYGANHILAKGVMPIYLTPNVFIAMRALGSTLLFWLVKLFLVSEKIERKDLFRMALCGVFGVANNQLFFFHGLNLSSSINAGIIMTLNPIMVAVLAFVFLKESLSFQKVTGIIIGATGAILLTLTAGSGSADSILGDLFLFINALSYGIYLILVKPLMSKYKPLTVITYVFTFGSMYVLLFPPTLMDLPTIDFAAIPVNVWAKILFVIIFVTFLVYLLTVYALQYLSASVSSTYIYLQPVMVLLFTVVFSYLGFAETNVASISWQKMCYMFIIFLGVFLVIRPGLFKSKSTISN